MNLEREYKIDVCADAVVTIRGPGKPRRQGAALPVYSVSTRARAELLRVTLCKLAYNGTDYLLPPELFDRELEQTDSVQQLWHIGERFAELDQTLTQGDA